MFLLDFVAILIVCAVTLLNILEITFLKRENYRYWSLPYLVDAIEIGAIRSCYVCAGLCRKLHLLCYSPSLDIVVYFCKRRCRYSSPFIKLTRQKLVPIEHSSFILDFAANLVLSAHPLPLYYAYHFRLRAPTYHTYNSVQLNVKNNLTHDYYTYIIISNEILLMLYFFQTPEFLYLLFYRFYPKISQTKFLG